MAITYDKNTKDIIINGFERGIGDSMHSGAAPLMGQYGIGGLGDMKNVNIISVPGEASVNFATAQISPLPVTTGTVTSANAGTFYATYTGGVGLENYMTIVFSAQSGLGVSTLTPYWIINLGVAGPGTFQITSDYLQATVVHLTNGTGTFDVNTVGANFISSTGGYPKFFTYDANELSNGTTPKGVYFMLTSQGDLWTNLFTTTSKYWTYVGPSGNTIDPYTGAGLAYYHSFDDSNSYVFVFRNSTIDYLRIKTGGFMNMTWVHNWNPLTGGPNYAGVTLNKDNPIHNAFVALNNVLYWCDGSFLGSVFEKPDGPPQTIVFDPSTPATYIYASQALGLPTLDQAQCLTQLGDNLLIGGKNNAIYPWDKTSPTFTFPILLPEYNVVQLVTVNTTTFIFVGNRGRIYYTNGTNAQLYKKVPDFMSNTVEPYFIWGGACSNKNQLFFSFSVTNNAGTTINNYGGLWAVDLDTKAIRLTNTFSYQTITYQGYSTAMIPNFVSNNSGIGPAGTGMYLGWTGNNNVTNNVSGIDTTTSAPYVGGTIVANAIIDSDLVPIGTYLKPTTNGRVEFKLTVPIVNGESVKLQYRQRFADTFIDIDSSLIFNFATIATGVWNGYAGVYQNVNFQNSQWIQIRAILTSTATNPSYTRLFEMRLGN